MSIQAKSAAAILGCANSKQLQRKLTRTAPTEIKLLIAFHRSVNSVISVALTNGASSTTHGNIGFIRSLGFQTADVVNVGCLSHPVESDDDSETYGNFRCSYSDDKENEDLCVVVRQAASVH